MDIFLYKTESAPNVVDKKLTEVAHYTSVRLLDDTSVLTPTIEVRESTIIDDLWSINYFYIPKFKRYYFVTDLTATTGMFRISGRVDVLRTYKSELNASSQIITRQQNLQDKYLHDSMIPISDKQEVQEVEFGETFDDSNSLFILVTTGQQGTGEGASE